MLDTLGDLHAATNAVLQQFGYPQRTMDEVRRFVGNGARRLIEQAVPQDQQHMVQQVLDTFQQYYAAHCDILTCPYPGVIPMLGDLGEKYPLAVVSNKPDRAVKELANIYFPNLYARGESEDCPRKPAPDMVHMAMETLGAERCIYVGDSEVDVLTAQNAGVPCLSVLWGFRDRDTLLEAGATHFCEDPKDLVKKLKEMM